MRTLLAAALPVLLAVAPCGAQGVAVGAPAGCARCPSVLLPVDSVRVSAQVDERGARTFAQHAVRNAGGHPVDAAMWIVLPRDARVELVAVMEGTALLAYDGGSDAGPPALAAEPAAGERRPPLGPLAGRRVVRVLLPAMAPGSVRRVQIAYREPPRGDGAGREYAYPLAASAASPAARIDLHLRVATPHGIRGEVASLAHAARVEWGSEPGPCHPQARCGTTNRPSRRILDVHLAAGPEAAAADFRIVYLPLRADDPGAVDGPEPWL